MKGTNSYQERNSIDTNRAEDIFLEYCKTRDTKVFRLGFDEKQGKVDRFYDLPPMVRNLPDFFVTTADKSLLVNVKGSPNIKEQEFELMEGFAHLYDSEAAPLYYAFCYEPDKVVFLKLEQVQAAYLAEPKTKTWPDGKRYKTLRSASA
jgi:hypothetical protein